MCPVGLSHALTEVLMEDLKLWMKNHKIKAAIVCGALIVSLGSICYFISKLVS